MVRRDGRQRTAAAADAVAAIGGGLVVGWCCCLERLLQAFRVQVVHFVLSWVVALIAVVVGGICWYWWMVR